MRHRWLSTAAVCIVVAAAVCLGLIVKWVNASAVRETKRVQRDLGFNLRILPREADLNQFLLRGYADVTMDASVIDVLATRKTLSYNHLVATLHKEIDLGGATAILTGVSETLFPPGQKKPPMGPSIKRGEAQIGSAIAARMGWKKGDAIQLLGAAIQVNRIVAETGATDDLRVWVNLADAQTMLNLESQISEVRAIDCLCLDPEDDPQTKLREEIESAAPQTQVVLMKAIATARARQRQMMDKFAALGMPLVALVGAAVVGAIGVYNVMQRKQEFAMFRAIGEGGSFIGSMVLMRVIACVLIGSALGGLVAWYLTGSVVPSFFPVTGKKPPMDVADVGLGALLALGFAVAASLAPLMIALAQSPAASLTEDR